MSRKERKKIIAYALESTYGVDAIDGTTPNYLLGREFTITPMAGENTSLEYDDGSLGNSPEIATEIYVTATFTVDFAAAVAVTTPAPCSALMQACLRGETVGADNVAYPINEDATGSLTLYYYQSGILHKITGARGSFSIDVKAKAFGGIKFSFTGLHEPVEDAALPMPDFTAWQTPLKIGAQNSSFTLGGTALKLISLEYDQANQVVYQEYVGHEEVEITDYQPSATIVVEAPTRTVFDPFTLAQNGDQLAVAFANGEVGNQIAWEASKVQIGRPTYGEQDGTQTYSIPLNIIGSSDTFTTR
jgi:hypothetical protein